MGWSYQQVQEELQEINFMVEFSQMYPVDLKKMLCQYEAA